MNDTYEIKKLHFHKVHWAKLLSIIMRLFKKNQIIFSKHSKSILQTELAHFNFSPRLRNFSILFSVFASNSKQDRFDWGKKKNGRMSTYCERGCPVTAPKATWKDSKDSLIKTYQFIETSSTVSKQFYFIYMQTRDSNVGKLFNIVVDFRSRLYIVKFRI